MNRIGVMVDSFRLGVLAGLDKAKDVGAGAVQIYVGDRNSPENVWTPAHIKEVLGKVKSLGMVVSAMCGELGGHGLSEREENEWKVPVLKRMMDVTVALECKVLTTHIGLVPSDKSHPRYAVILDALRELSDYGKQIDCYIAIETGPEKPETLKMLLDDIPSGHVGINYDPANLKMVLAIDEVQGVRTLKGHILHTHAKDGKMLKNIGPEAVYGYIDEAEKDNMGDTQAYLETPLGEGQVDFPNWIKALEEIGYQGYLTIEREVGGDPEGDIRKAVKFLENLL